MLCVPALRGSFHAWGNGALPSEIVEHVRTLFSTCLSTNFAEMGPHTHFWVAQKHKQACAQDFHLAVVLPDWRVRNGDDACTSLMNSTHALHYE